MTRRLPWKQGYFHFFPIWLLFAGLFMGLNPTLHAQLQVAFSIQDAICYSLPNGSITATASNGTPNYNYVWNNGQTGPTISGLVAGTYTVTVSDSGGQSIVRSATVGQPPLVTVIIVPDDICNSPFVLTAVADGGIPGYNYNWSTGAMTPSISVPPGNYCVTITDQNSCGAIDCITVDVTAPSVSVTANRVTCPGGSDGSVTATPFGGLPPYSFAWSNGGSGQTITGLSAGSYTVTLTDANGCTDTATGFVNQPPPININLNPNNPVCVGDFNGSITSNVSGGNPPYNLSWNTGSSNANLFNLGPGTYILTVIDSEGCVNSASVTLNYQSNLTLGGLGTPETCPNANDGFATANPQGGVMPYTYLWEDGFNEQVVSNAAPGNYAVTVTDAVGCVATTVINVPAAPDFTVVASGSNPTTCGATNGSATVNIVQGVGPFTFAWNNGANTQTIFGLSAGTYTVVVTNSSGCVTSSSTTLVAPPEVFVNATATPVLCEGSNAGTATANVTGGTPPFNFNWSNGANTQTITGLNSGTYNVIVTDANGCSDIDAVTIAAAPAVTFNLTGTQIVCGEGNTGSAVAIPTGGTGPFTFLWSTGATSNSVSGLGSGTYSVTVTDANGCSATQSITIRVIDDLDVAVIGTPVDCADADNGTATALPSGGDAPYTFAWNNGSSQQSLTGLGPGTYVVTVTDANGCTTAGSYIVSSPPGLNVSITPSNPVNCFGEADASLTANASGGTPAYSYMWNTGANTQTITNLPAGFYSVTVTDNNGCQKAANFTVTQTAEFMVNVTGNTTICGDANSGFANAIPVGGQAPYTFAWSNGSASASINGLSSGTYNVTATDANGCTAQGSITINIISDFDATLIPRDVLCFGGNTGSVLAQPTGGNAPYTYQWSTGANTSSINNLTAGTYTVIITDANGCSVTRSASVGQPGQLGASVTGTDPECPGDSNGTANTNVNGGTAPFTFSWNNGATTQNLTGLSAGTYIVTVTDANLCVTSASITLTDPPGLDVNVTSPTISCGGTSSGSASAIVSGGSPGYTYLWSDGQTTQTAVGLAAGAYSLTVTDANGCFVVETTILVNELPAINIDFNIGNLECTSAAIGSVTAIVTNGTPPYSYAWSNGANTQTISGLTAGSYTVTVTDSQGCSAEQTATVMQTNGFVATINGTNVTCNGFNNGSATVNINGGTAPFAFNWSNGANTQTISGLSPGTYTVTVTDANECIDEASVTITQPAPLSTNISDVDIECGGNTGSASVVASGGTSPYTYAWNTGQTTSTITNLGVGTYTVTVTDANGCTTTNSTTITSNSALTVNITQNSGTCTDFNMGILVANVMGGVGPYTYLWSNGTTTQTNSNLASGTYSVTVTDSNGCQTSGSAAVTTFPSVSCNVEILGSSTLGNNGSVRVNVTGGTAPFSYNWSNGATTELLTGLAPGTYSVTVSDANGCQTLCSTTLDALAGIGNFVWEDIDHDGQQDPDEPVVPGVTVNLKDQNGMVIATTVTDENGEYYFLGLDPGTYSVMFVIPDGFDYTASNMGDDALDSDIIPGMNGMTGEYVLDAGELDFTVDAGIYVPPNGVISDPCSCLNNSTTENNGQFLEVFTVRSYPNETWTVIDGSGMYSLTSPEPPALPMLLTFPFGMVEVEPGVYEFPFRLVDEITYTVVVTNGFDTLSISNTCEYPTLNINELPPAELCLADAPIELGANPNIPGNLIFTINGVISTTIDPSQLDTGSYLLVATLVPVDPEECEATIETQFTITSDCLATVGDQVWLDLNCDGIQGGGEPGVPGVEVTITGTAEFLDPNINMTTFTDANGNYEFMVPPGNYKLTFGDVAGYDITTPNVGGNDNIDSDVSVVTGMTDFFHLDPDEVNLTFDLGLCPECINIDYPGAIGYDQYLCAAGNTPDPFVSLAMPSGGDGPIEYLWMQTNGSPGTPIQYWTPIPNSNSPTYAAGQVFTTTYYARCARTQDCGTFLESNIIVVEVGDEVEAIINGPGLVCWNEATTFTAEALPAGAQVTWNFTGGPTPSTVNGPTATVTYTNVGNFEVELIVTVDGCTAYAYKSLTITTLPTICNQGLLIDSDIMNPEAGDIMVSWEMNANIPGLTYHVEHSTNGEDFERIATITEEVRQLNGVRYYEYHGTAPKRGINYYQVEAEDAEGNTVYSNIEELVLYTESKIAMLYPNPVSDVLYMEIFETFDADEVSVEVFSVSGQKMATIAVATNARQVQLDFARFPAGAYMVRLVYGETNIRTMKVIKR